MIVEQAAQQPKSFEKESVYNEEALIQSTQQRQSRDLKLAYRLTGNYVCKIIYDSSFECLVGPYKLDTCDGTTR